MSDRINTAAFLTIHLDERLLPGIVREIAALIGLSATLKLVEHYPGIPMWVPVKYDPDHALVKIVGHEAASKLVDNYGGESYQIAKCEHAIRAVRNTRICNSDKSQRQLAIEHGLTIRQIRNIQSGVEFDDGQDDFFQENHMYREKP